VSQKRTIRLLGRGAIGTRSCFKLILSEVTAIM
jgi:hypothetical protein